jgi:hypothetical protein
MHKSKILFNLLVTGLAGVLILTACQIPGVTTAAPAPPANPPATAAPANPPAPTATTAPAATATPAPVPTDTPAPTATPAPAATDTLAPTAQVAPQVTVSLNAYCRKGPGTGYFSLAILQKGNTYNVVGRNDTNTWFLVQASNTITCWEGDSKATLLGPVTEAPGVLVPPVPAMPASFDRVPACAGDLNVTLRWAPVDGATGYSIYRNGAHLVSVAAGVTTFYDQDAPMDIDLLYEVQAFNDYGASASNTTNVSACPS